MALPEQLDLASPGRLAAVRATGLLDTPPEAAFDRLTRLAARLVGAPVTMVSLFDAERQFVKSAVGVPEAVAGGRAVPLPRSICRYVIASGEMLAVEDARSDPRFVDHPAIREHGAVAYLGLPLRDAEGFVLGTLCALDREPRPWSACEIAALTDVAEIAETEMRLRAAANRLRASEAQYRVLAEAAGDGILTAGEDGIIRYANPAAERLFGYEAAAMRGLHLSALMPERQHAHLDRALTRYVATGRRTADWSAVPTQGRRHDGTVVPLEVAFGESIDNGTRIFTAVVRDVTARHAAEGRLGRTTAELRALIQASPLAIAMFDPEGRVHRWNAAAERLFGWSAAETVGQVLPFIPPEPDFRARLGRVMGGNPAVGEEVRRRRKDGSYVDVALSTAVLHGEPDAPVRIVAIYQDVTARRRADRLAQVQGEVLARIAAGAPLREVLDRVLAFVESEAPESCCLVRRLDPVTDSLRLVASRGLPVDFATCHTNLIQCASAGPCAATVLHGRAVIVPDLRVGTLFPPERRDDLLRLGFLGSWCRPIVDVAGKVLGTFGGYFREAREPSEAETQLFDLVGTLLATALERETWAEELRSSEARARARLTELEGIYQSAPIGISLVDRDLRLVRINDTLAGFTGRPAAECIGRTLREVIPHGADEVEQRYREVIETGIPLLDVHIELPATGDVRHVRHFSASYTAVRGGDAAIVGVSAVVVETTERRRLEAELREREARLQALFENVPTGLAILDTDLRYVAVNPTLAAIKSISIADHIGRQPHDLMRGIGAFAEVKLRQVLETRRPVPTEVHSDGTDLRPGDYHATYFPVLAGDTLLGVGIVVLDVTAEKSLEEQLRQSQKMEAVGRLAGGIAHDFNNLLTAILSYSELLLSDLPPDNPLRGDVAEIRAAGERAAGLTRQLLAFSRRQVLQPRSLSLSSVVAGLDKMLRRLIGEDIELETDLADDVWSVMADQGQIEQVLLNLAVNARDAMLEGGTLTITTANVTVSAAQAKRLVHLQPRDYATLTVSDTGQGMDAATQERIFEPFFTTKEPGKGTGLGLATVYGIVKQSGGSVFVASEVNVGTRFTIFLPASHGDVVSIEPAPVEHGKAGSETILLVEDDAQVRRLAREVFARQGYRVLEADCGTKALEIVAGSGEPIDLLVTDIVMPRISGQQLAAQLTERQPSLKVLFMSGYSEEAIKHHGILAPGTGLLTKPFTPESLIAQARGLLDRA